MDRLKKAKIRSIFSILDPLATIQLIYLDYKICDKTDTLKWNFYIIKVTQGFLNTKYENRIMQSTHIAGSGTPASLQHSPQHSPVLANTQTNTQQSPAGAVQQIWQSTAQSLGNAKQCMSKNSTKIAFWLSSFSLCSSTYGDLHDSLALKEVGFYLSVLSLPFMILSIRADMRNDENQQMELEGQDRILERLEGQVDKLDGHIVRLATEDNDQTMRQTSQQGRLGVDRQNRLNSLERRIAELEGRMV